jgi:hypothetical protein
MAADHLLGEVDQVAVVRVGLVELQHRELGIVPGGQPLVAEVAVDLIDALEAADTRRFRYSSGAMRRNSCMSSAL